MSSNMDNTVETKAPILYPERGVSQVGVENIDGELVQSVAPITYASSKDDLTLEVVTPVAQEGERSVAVSYGYSLAESDTEVSKALQEKMRGGIPPVQ